MAKTIHFKVTEQMYYDLVAVRAKLAFDTWEQLMNHIIQTHNPKQPEPTKQPIGISMPEKVPTLDELIDKGVL